MVKIGETASKGAVTHQQELLAKAATYLTQDKLDLIQKAYEFAREAHLGQFRKSGEPYLEHPVQTARFLVDLRLDASTIAAALLHDVIEDCGVSQPTLRKQFGEEISSLVDGVTKLSRLNRTTVDERETEDHVLGDGYNQAASLRKMLVAMAEDIRVVLIKLADRFHNMRTLAALPYERQVAIAQETVDIYAPLAHRLGMWDLKWHLEDLAFRFLKPDKYKEISQLLSTKREERENYVRQVTSVLTKELEEAGVMSQVSGRPKHLYSIYRKVRKYAAQGKDFSDIYDLFAVRVLVNEIKDCYSALGIIHGLWHPLPGQFDDYIANPKDNLYQSLHTTVRCIGGVHIEIQVRTERMHQLSEYGVAAHWRYKEGGHHDMRFEEKMTWLRQLLEWQREVSGAEEFLQSVKTDIFHDQVFVYTPKGNILELPASSTPIDFAYRIHTDLGHRCIGAKINGKIVSLDYQLQNSDTVEVLAAKVARGPSLDWLNPDLGYAQSANAQRAIRLWFRRQNKGVNIERGHNLLAKEIRRHGFDLNEEEVAQLFKYDVLDDFLVALGSGVISIPQVIHRLAPQDVEQDSPAATAQFPQTTGPASGLQVLGVGDLLTHLAWCCSPLPGDEIVGFVTRNRGVSVHLKTCPNVANDDEPERLVKVEWGKTKQLHPVRVTIIAMDRVGLLSDVTSVVSREGVNIASVFTEEHQDENTASFHLTLYITDIGQLGRLYSKLEGVRGVLQIERSTIAQLASQKQKNVAKG